eukprot:74824_1
MTRGRRNVLVRPSKPVYRRPRLPKTFPLLEAYLKALLVATYRRILKVGRCFEDLTPTPTPQRDPATTPPQYAIPVRNVRRVPKDCGFSGISTFLISSPKLFDANLEYSYVDPNLEGLWPL